MPRIRLADIHDFRLEPFSRLTELQLRDCVLDPEGRVLLDGALRAVQAQTGLDGCTALNGLFVAESANVIMRALAAGVRPVTVLVEEHWLNRSQDVIAAMEEAYAKGPSLQAGSGLPIFVCDRDQFTQVTGYEVARGALAVMERPALPDVRELLGALPATARVAVLEDVTNYTNIGAIFRSAAALGIDAVLVTPSCHDPYYRRAARVSMGTVFQVPWTRIGMQQDWAEEGVPLLRSCGFKTVALALTDDSLGLQDPRLKQEERLALILGTEGDGLSRTTIAATDYTVKIPMDHDVDSLNVAAASAVAFWELRSKWRD